MPEGTRPAPPAGSCRVTTQGTYLGHKWACIWWLNLTSANPQAADLILLAAKVGSAWGTNVSPQLSPGAVMNTVLLVWTPVLGQEIVATDTTAHAGGQTGGEMTNSASCYVVNHRTGAYYRGGHPRSYVPGVPPAHVTAGSTIDTSQCTLMASGWSAMVNAINTGPAGAINGAVAGTVRFASKGAWLNPPTFVPWQSHSVRPTLGTIKARLTE